ncbi:MAG TPA: ribosome silencing factor [Bryobacteraceae bacterium]|nr:ribosome silencing factor [Bryobacteraceae bacterium]
MPTPTNSDEAQQPADETLDAVLAAARAADSKKASAIRVLDLREITTFAEYFLVCTGNNQRQIQAIADDVHHELKQDGRIPLGIEGYDKAEWVLLDYGDFLVHVFSEAARKFYDLERLWRAAKDVPVEQTGPA